MRWWGQICRQVGRRILVKSFWKIKLNKKLPSSQIAQNHTKSLFEQILNSLGDKETEAPSGCRNPRSHPEKGRLLRKGETTEDPKSLEIMKGMSTVQTVIRTGLTFVYTENSRPRQFGGRVYNFLLRVIEFCSFKSCFLSNICFSLSSPYNITSKFLQ